MKLTMFQIGAFFVSACPLVGQNSSADFVGTWELASWETRSEAGDWVPLQLPMSAIPVGIIMYDAHGNMAVQITNDPRVELSNGELVNGYLAYYARYEVDSDAGTVTHHRRNHNKPDYGDLSVVRDFEFSGNMLTLTVVPAREARLNWIRVP